jgi:hypothetical protein
VDPRAVLDAVVNRKISIPHEESNPGTLIVKMEVARYFETSVPYRNTTLRHSQVNFDLYPPSVRTILDKNDKFSFPLHIK